MLKSVRNGAANTIRATLRSPPDPLKLLKATTFSPDFAVTKLVILVTPLNTGF